MKRPQRPIDDRDLYWFAIAVDAGLLGVFLTLLWLASHAWATH